VGEADPVDRTCSADYSVQVPGNPEEVLVAVDIEEVVVVEEGERRKIA
jgi:hypothetical protein